MAPIIIRLFEWYATGIYSLREITKMAQVAGIVFRGSENPVPTATVHAILRNCIYTEDFNWQGKRYRGIHVPLITHDLWDYVQKILDDRSRTHQRKVKHDFAFSGLIACGHCGYSLVGEISWAR
jgi:site-specific DNA recombinase